MRTLDQLFEEALKLPLCEKEELATRLMYDVLGDLQELGYQEAV